MDSTLLEEGFPWQELRDKARREGTHRPAIYTLHRWWARRSPSLFRSVLSAAVLSPEQRDQLALESNGSQSLQGLSVLDPFVGGGTSLVEASRLGASVIGYDVEELACRISGAELAAPGAKVDWTLIDGAVADVKAALQKYYPSDGDWLVLHYFWVDHVTCPHCRRVFDAHPRALLARDNDHGKQAGFCLKCSELHNLELGRKWIYCGCGHRSNLQAGNCANGFYSCPHCSGRSEVHKHIAKYGRPLRRLVAKEMVHRKSRLRRRFDMVSQADRLAFAAARAELAALTEAWYPTSKIPAGKFDGRPQIHGFQSWNEMFNERQLLHHSMLRKAIVGLPEPERGYAMLAFSESLATNCMFCPYSTDYRRLAALFSIHGYMYVARPVELNPWLLGSGRGTFPNCLRKVRAGVTAESARPKAKWKLLNGSSEDLSAIADKSVNLILTDPPFYSDNLDYGHLAAFYSAWAPEVSDESAASGGGTPLQGNDGISTFAERLGEVFKECHRVLADDGLLTFTFAHARSTGWAAVESAVRAASFVVTAAIPVEAEGSNGFHSGPGNLKWNGLLVCRKSSNRPLNTKPMEEALALSEVSDADKQNLRRALAAAHALSFGGRDPHG
jgi:putative DNA methylase